MIDGPDHELAEHALRQLRSTAVPVEGGESVERRRPRLVSALKREIRAVPSRRVHRERWVSGLRTLASVAAAVSLTWGAMHLFSGEAGPSTPTAHVASGHAQLRGWSGDVRVGPPGHEHALEATEGVAVGGASFLSTRQSGWAELELPGAVRVEVNSSTQLQLLEAEAKNKHLRLALGRVDIQVPKPTGGAKTRLVVSTPDAEVEVRGTVFSVEVRPGRTDPARLITEVFVSRGAVAVRYGSKEHVVAAGTGWSSEHAPTAAPAPEVSNPAAAGQAEAAAGAEPVPTGADARRKKSPSEGKVTSTASTLAEENRLFERALAARDRGASDEAIALCDRFLARYPASTLAESVRLERSRVLEQKRAVERAAP